MRRCAGGRLAFAAALLTLIIPPGAARTEPVLRLAGVLSLEPRTAASWCWSGAWEFPVANALDLGAPGPGGVPGFHLNRNVGLPGSYAHQGVELVNGRGGDPVRAAAHGLVVATAADGWNGGYGNFVVLAHRRPEGGLVYSVYAHLLGGSVRVSPGDLVVAGTQLGRVGRSGRATTLHLHFEVRLAGPWDERWEKARVVDPVSFVRARLPGRRAGGVREARLIGWAEYAALVAPGSDAGVPIPRSMWWLMIARAAKHSHDEIPERPEDLREMLEADGLITAPASRDAAGAVEWSEIAAGLERLAETGLRLPPAPHAESELAGWCRERFGESHPGRHPERLERAAGRSVTALDACLLLADAAGPSRGGSAGTPRGGASGPPRGGAARKKR